MNCLARNGMLMWRFRSLNAGAIGKILMVLMMVFPSVIQAASPAAPKMRPYSGIGVLLLSAPPDDTLSEPLYLYEEPALSRIGPINIAKPPAQEWIFGANRRNVQLIVMARRGKWLQVTYDDAGREAWLAPGSRGNFLPWSVFLKGQSIRMLPGLQKRFYQLFKQPGTEVMTTVTSKQAFRVLKVEGDWGMMMADQKNIGWLRWRDEDGRLLVGLN